MKTRRTIAAAAALLTIMMTLASCGKNDAPAPVAPAPAQAETVANAPAEAPEEAESLDKKTASDCYKIIVTDENGDPVKNTMVQFCSADKCLFSKTGADGTASFDRPEGKYTAHILKAPEGFESDETEYEVPETYGTVTIVLKTAGNVADSVADSAEAPAEASAADSADNGDTVNFDDLGIAFTVPAKYSDMKGSIAYDGAVLSDEKPRLAVWEVIYAPIEESQSDAFYDYYMDYDDALSLDKELPQPPVDWWGDPCEMIKYPFEVITVYDELDEDISKCIEKYGLSQGSDPEFIGEKGNTKFYLLTDSVQDSDKESLGSFYDEYAALVSDKDTFISSLTFSEGEAPSNDIPMPEKIVFETKDLDGNTVSSADIFAGHKVTMINLWGTYCGPCKGELEELGKLAKEFEAKDCQIIGICGDAVDEKKITLAKELLAKNNCEYLNVTSWDTFYDDIPAPCYPCTYFVDSEGNVIGERINGADVAGYSRVLEKCLAEMN